MKKTLFTCRCGSIQHIFVVTADDEDLFIEVHLAPLPLWQRVRQAVKYLFGYRSKWGDFDEIMLDSTQALQLGDLIVDWAQGSDTGFYPNDVH
jgi:hypothetical protein